MAHYDKLHEGGAVAFAEGAKAAGTSMWTGMSSDEDHEKLIAVGAPAGRIIKPFADHERVIAHVRHDARCGAAAWAMDIDHVYKKDGSRYDFFGAPLESPTRAVLEAYVNCAPLPFFPKGVVSVRDAVLCAEAGCAGVIISHHQNMFPWTVPPLRALREIRRVLKPGGLLFAPTYAHGGAARPSARVTLMRLLGFRVYHKWTAGEFRDFLAAAGFRPDTMVILADELAPLCYIDCINEK
jgi:SAM-dependent methyltransferase